MKAIFNLNNQKSKHDFIFIKISDTDSDDDIRFYNAEEQEYEGLSEMSKEKAKAAVQKAFERLKIEWKILNRDPDKLNFHGVNP